MLASYIKLRATFVVIFSFVFGFHAYAQIGASGSVNGTVVDPSGAVVANATVEISNPVSQYRRTTTTDSNGSFNFRNVPFNQYRVTATASGFAPGAQDVELRSIVPVSSRISLQVSGSTEIVTVQATAGDLIENSSTFHTELTKTCSTSFPWKANHHL